MQQSAQTQPQGLAKPASEPAGQADRDIYYGAEQSRGTAELAACLRLLQSRAMRKYHPKHHLGWATLLVEEYLHERRMRISSRCAPWFDLDQADPRYDEFNRQTRLAGELAAAATNTPAHPLIRLFDTEGRPVQGSVAFSLSSNLPLEVA